MKVIRRLSRHGNSFHVSMPPQFIDYLRLRAGDGMVVEVTERRTIEIRIAAAADLRGATIAPLTMDMSAPAAK